MVFSCQPILGSLGSGASARTGLCARSQHFRGGNFKPCFCQGCHARSDCTEAWSCIPGKPLHHGVCHCGVPFSHHGEVGPGCPMRSPLLKGAEAILAQVAILFKLLLLVHRGRFSVALFSRVLLRSCQPYHGTQGMDCSGGPQRMAPGFEGSAASGCQVADGGEEVEVVTRFTSAASPTQWSSPHTSVERSPHWTLAQEQRASPDAVR